jgi:hypothetical protein
MSDSNYVAAKRARSTASKETPAVEAEAQQVLDQLWREQLIPFQLSVGKMTEKSGEYTIHFHDSRIFTVCVPLIEGHSFSDSVRTAVLERVEKVSGPLTDWQKKGSD